MINIALCDFNHTTIGVHTETFPMAIGLIGSYVKKLYPNEVDVRLFKFIDDFSEELTHWVPDVMGFSLYSWNTKLNLHMANYVHSIHSDVMIVVGGPNIPIDEDEILDFFNDFPIVDIIVDKDGEVPFSSIIGSMLRGNTKELIKFENLSGTIVLNKSSHSVVSASTAEKIRNLDEIPSPYLNGLMDKFFDNKQHNLAPFIETNRGCPFACTFCHTALKYYNKIQWKTGQRLEQELELFGKYFQDRHEIRLFLADNNFGSFKQDHEVANIIRKIQDKYNWPRYIDVTTGKTKPDNILAVKEKLKWGLTVTASLQTLTDVSLKNVKRKNLHFDDFIRLQKKSKKENDISSTELIMSLPGETKDTFLNTIEMVIESGIEQIIIYTLMNLRGTPLYAQLRNNPDGHMFKYRIVPRQFGKYHDKYVFDNEEVVVQTPDFSFDDYIYVRGFALVVQTVYNDSHLIELINFLLVNEVSLYDLLIEIYKQLLKDDSLASAQLFDFIEETKMELWDTEDSLNEFYSIPANYQKLVDGELGGNLLAKYTWLARSSGFESWLDISLDCAKSLAIKSSKLPEDVVITIFKDFKTYFMNTKNIYEVIDKKTYKAESRVSTIRLSYDISKWAENRDWSNIEAYNRNYGNYSVHYSDAQIRNIKTISLMDSNEKSVKLQFIAKGHSKDYWAKLVPDENHVGRVL